MTRDEMVTLLRACVETNVLGSLLEDVADQLEEQDERAARLQSELEESEARAMSLEDDLKAERQETRTIDDAADALRALLVAQGLPANPVSRPPGELGALAVALGVCE